MTKLKDYLKPTIGSENGSRITTEAGLKDLVMRLSKKLSIDSSRIFPYVDFTEMMSSLLDYLKRDQVRILVADHATPDIEIAADRAGLDVEEVLGASPFISHPEDLIDAIKTDDEIIYLANPNWVTGSNYSLKDLSLIVESVKSGWLIIDEKYFDYYGISSLPLLEKHPQIIISQSLTASFGIGSDDSGFLVGSAGFIGEFRNNNPNRIISTTLYRLLTTSLTNEKAASKRLISIHDEALRLATTLTKQSVQNRLTATDFILLRVADPKAVGNYLARFGSPIENLDGYHGLKGYVKYQIQSPISNDRFLLGMSRMPKEYYHLEDIDHRAVMFHRPDETSKRNINGNNHSQIRGNKIESEIK